MTVAFEGDYIRLYQARLATRPNDMVLLNEAELKEIDKDDI